MMYKHLFELAKKHELVLGSSSPRRMRLLKEIGVDFKQIIPQLDEVRNSDEDPFPFARRLAEEKALWVANHTDAEKIVIGCDTIVVLGNRILSKPQNDSDAYTILSALAGKQHIVCTAIALVQNHKLLVSGYELTRVFFNQIDSQQIHDYIASREPMDKAGAYGIQGMGAFLVDRIEGNLDNVIGLPRMLLDKLSKKAPGSSEVRMDCICE